MILLASLSLPAGLLWSDEFAWQPVAQSVERALDGSQIVFEGALSAGQPITLESGAWVKRDAVLALQALASAPDAIYPLTLRGVSYQVRFRHHEAPAVSAVPLFPMASPAADDFYTVSIKLMTV